MSEKDVQVLQTVERVLGKAGKLDVLLVRAGKRPCIANLAAQSILPHGEDPVVCVQGSEAKLRQKLKEALVMQLQGPLSLIDHVTQKALLIEDALDYLIATVDAGKSKQK